MNMMHGQQGMPSMQSMQTAKIAGQHLTVGHSQTYFGTIKNYNIERGWGHIECPQTKAIYGKDMFVLKSAIQQGAQDAVTGYYVSFTVQMGRKGPEATNLRLVGQGGLDVAYSG